MFDTLNYKTYRVKFPFHKKLGIKNIDYESLSSKVTPPPPIIM